MVSRLETKNASMRIILASKSPRRRELLAGLGFDFKVEVIDGINEDYPRHLRMEEIPQFIAKEKAAVCKIMQDDVLLTADTIVVLDNIIMGKPKNKAEACRMLQLLSGRTHHVITGVCITTMETQTTFSETTAVTFRELSEAEINYYVTHYQPYDKAGAYGIQEWIGYVGVTKIDGSFYNVMGLPVEKVYEILKTIALKQR